MDTLQKQNSNSAIQNFNNHKFFNFLNMCNSSLKTYLKIEWWSIDTIT